MDTFSGATSFCYNQRQDDSEESFAGLLTIFAHYAHNIHNICIYANQDVYAKFSLTCNPDDVISTKIIAGGGKNPQFDEELKIKITQPDPVLKCEIWMLSRAKCYLEDQLLGFTLVPLSLVASTKGKKLTEEFSLSSTDLFDSPAGTVKLTLSLDPSAYHDKAFDHEFISSSSISSEVMILEPVEYGSIEFPDISVAKENQQMVLQYFNMESAPKAVVPFLHLRASTQATEDCDMIVNSSEEKDGVSESLHAGLQNSGLFSTFTMTSLSDDRVSDDSMEKKIQVPGNISSIDYRKKSEASPETPTSKNSQTTEAQVTTCQEDLKGLHGKQRSADTEAQIGSGFNMKGINIDAEQSAMQQQIVDMYMKSMRQFTDSLAKMKLPMDLDNKPSLQEWNVIQVQNSKPDLEKGKKDGPRVFYGSRAFF